MLDKACFGCLLRVVIDVSFAAMVAAATGMAAAVVAAIAVQQKIPNSQAAAGCGAEQMTHVGMVLSVCFFQCRGCKKLMVSGLNANATETMTLSLCGFESDWWTDENYRLLVGGSDDGNDRSAVGFNNRF